MIGITFLVCMSSKYISLFISIRNVQLNRKENNNFTQKLGYLFDHIPLWYSLSKHFLK